MKQTYTISIDTTNKNLKTIAKELLELADKYPNDTFSLKQVSDWTYEQKLYLHRHKILNKEEIKNERIREIKSLLSYHRKNIRDYQDIIKLKYTKLHNYLNRIENKKIKGIKDPFMVCKSKKMIQRIEDYQDKIGKEKDKIKALVEEAMTLVDQIPNKQNIKQHGESVFAYYQDLFNDKKMEWKLPDWFFENEQWIKENIYQENIMKEYLLNHDCGKPFVFTEDETGRHFPDHEEKSYHIYKSMNYHQYTNIVADLIRRDMDIHTMKAKDLINFCRHKKQALSLLVAGLCEVHSNVALFGGIDSTSFKIKWKQIDRRGKQIIKHLKS